MKKTNFFPTNLRFLLKKNGFSQEDLANLIGKDRTTVGIYVKGSSQPDQDITIQIATILKVSIEELLLEDLTSENYSHKERKVSMVSESEQETYGGSLHDALSEMIKKAVGEYFEKDGDTRGQIQYIYDTLKSAELLKEIDKTVKKVRSD